MLGESVLPLPHGVDVTAFYYSHHLHGNSLASINDPNNIVLSSAVSALLDSHELVFGDAPGLLQRALVWESGRLSSIDSDKNEQFVQIFTSCGTPMASVTLSEQDIGNKGCRLDSDASSTARLCHYRTLAAASKCAVRSHEFARLESLKGVDVRIWDDENLGRKWTLSELQPHMSKISLIDEHVTNDIPVILFESSEGQCHRSSKGACSAPTFAPCTVLETDAWDNDKWCLPEPSELLDRWVQEHQARQTITGGSESASRSIGDSSGAVILEMETITIPREAALPDMMLGTTGISVPDPAAQDVSTSLTSLWRTGSSGNDPISTSADLAREYFRLHELDSGLDFDLSKSVKLPEEVNNRLKPFQINFGQLSGLLRLALLWDSGYVLATDADEKPLLVPVWVRCGLRMADIAVPRSVYELSGCATSNCSSFNASTNITVSSFHSSIDATSASSCSPRKLTTTTLCAADTSSLRERQVSLAASNASIWSVGPLSVSSAHAIPHPTLKRHQFIHEAYTAELFGIHTHYTLDQTEHEVLNGQQCPRVPSLVVPCVSLEQVSGEDSDNWCRPEPSHLVSAWLVVEERQYRTLFHLVALGMAVILAIAIDLYFDRKPRRVRAAATVGAVALPSVASSALDFDPETNSSTHLSAASAMSGMSSRQTGGADDWD